MGFDFYKEVISPTLGVLYRSRDTTGDFVVICDEGKELKCHKIVLATGSPVFRAMLNSGCKEVEGSEVKVSNFRFEVMEKLIDFFYLSEVQEDFFKDVDNSDILEVANFYQVPLLKNAMEYLMLNQMDQDTALEYFRLSVVYNADILNVHSKSFILNRKYDMFKEEKWIKCLLSIDDQNMVMDLIKGFADPSTVKSRCLYCKRNLNSSAKASYCNNCGRHSVVMDFLCASSECRRCSTTGVNANAKFSFWEEDLNIKLENEKIAAFKEMFNDENFSYIALDEEMKVSKVNPKVCGNAAYIRASSEQLFEKIGQNNDSEVKDIVKFLYCGKIDGYEMRAKELIEIAHNLNVPSVKIYCEESLIDTLTVENVLERFIFATDNDCDSLRDQSKEMIVKENKRLIKTDNWKKLVQENPAAMFELNMELFSKMVNNK